MKKHLKIGLLIMLTLTFSCNDDGNLDFEEGNYAPGLSFSRESSMADICDPVVQITVESTQKRDNDRVIEFTVNEDPDVNTALSGEYEFSTMSVTIPAGSYTGTTEVTINYDQLPDDVSRDLVIDLTIPNGSKVNARGTSTISFASACTLNNVELSFVFDSYPEEFAWQLYDADNGNAFVTGDAGYGNYDGLSNFETTLCLPSGNYLLRMLDSFGDGFCCNYGIGTADISLQACDGSSPVTPTISSEFNSGEFIRAFSVGL